MSALPPQLLQFAGSLVAILALALVSRWLGLGRVPTIADEAALREACEHAAPGFVATDFARDRTGRGAIARDAAGRVLVLRGHGAHLAGRILSPLAQASADERNLTIATGERRFGTVTLELDDASAWVQAIAAIKDARHA